MKFDGVANPRLDDQSGGRSNTLHIGGTKKPTSFSAPRLRPGDRAALRPPAEILATLDARCAYEGVPFMPEMLRYFGQAFTVAKRVEKICDTICPTASRRMRGCVFLDTLRCDGTGHGGCQAECRIYWKEAWLVRLAPDALPPQPDEASVAVLRAATEAEIRQPEQPGLFRCQVTEARRATTELPDWDVRQYAREVSSGNVTLGQVLRVGLRAVPHELRRFARMVVPDGLRPFARRLRARLHARIVSRERPAPLGLQPGEWVEVRSAGEIKVTLDARGFNRGMSFAAAEMFPACGNRFRVRRRVDRIIDEPTGRMLEMKHDCIVLEGFVCTGDRSAGRWFCAREIYPYWREAWLKRVTGPVSIAHPPSRELQGL